MNPFGGKRQCDLLVFQILLVLGDINESWKYPTTELYLNGGPDSKLAVMIKSGQGVGVTVVCRDKVYTLFLSSPYRAVQNWMFVGRISCKPSDICDSGGWHDLGSPRKLCSRVTWRMPKSPFIIKEQS